jgi:CBS domain-containing protein
MGTKLLLAAEFARDLMHANPISLRKTATIKEAAALFADRSISAAPVINEAGRALGVVSLSDLARHEREAAHYAAPMAEKLSAELREGFQIEQTDATTVEQIMTPIVFSVAPDTPVRQIVKELVTRRVHRLFVLDDTGVLVGVISPFDILQRLQ